MGVSESLLDGAYFTRRLERIVCEKIMSRCLKNTGIHEDVDKEVEGEKEKAYHAWTMY